MLLTAEQKQKYLAYLEGKKKTSVKSQIDTEDENILEFILSDVIEKLKQKTIDIQNLEILSSTKFKDGLLNECMYFVIDIATDSEPAFYTQELADAIEASESIEEILEKISLLSAVSPKFAGVIGSAFLGFYQRKCLEFGIIPDFALMEIFYS